MRTARIIGMKPREGAKGSGKNGEGKPVQEIFPGGQG
jgi:hypothetical protein